MPALDERSAHRRGQEPVLHGPHDDTPAIDMSDSRISRIGRHEPLTLAAARVYKRGRKKSLTMVLPG
jgi:hypothetical protein